MPSLIPTLTEINELARGAGKILLSRYGKTHQIKYKGSIDPVTEADKLSETFILDYIRSKFPEHRIVAEESGSNHKVSDYCWYIDPLDGTVNFAHGIPIFSVSIAFTIQDEITLSAVFDPSRNELFSAEKGKGATLNGQPIQVSSCDQLIQSLLVTGFPYDMATTDQHNLENYGRLARMTQGVRRLGSAALDCCNVACGRFDGYWELSTEPWDIAAGVLITTEAGGVVTNAEGSPLLLANHPSILCSTPFLHPLIKRELNN